MKRLLYLLTFLLIVLSSCQTAELRTPVSSPIPLQPTVTPTLFSGSGRVKLDDITMYFEAHGEGKPLILLHGANGSAMDWANQVTVFNPLYYVITPDSRGQGRTTDSDAPIGYHLMAEDTTQLMDALGIDSAYIVGWSDGAIIGIDLAIHHPERVKALVAYGANTSPEGLTESFLEMLRDPSYIDIPAIQMYNFLSPQPERLPIIREKIRQMLLTQPNFTQEELAGITVPTLILDGEEEEFILIDHVKAIAKAIPGAKLILLPGVGHFAPQQTPEKFNPVVLDFLKDN